MFHRISVISSKSEQKTKATVMVTLVYCILVIWTWEIGVWRRRSCPEWSALKRSKAEVELLVYTRSVNLHNFCSVIYLMNASMSPTAGM